MNDDQLLRPLMDPPTDEVETLRRLHARLVGAATDAGILDVVYRTIDSPIGLLLLACTDAGLVRVAFDSEDHDRVLEDLAAQVSPRILRVPARLDDTARQVDEYFSGSRTEFDVALDLRLSAGFRREVLDHLPEIPYGRTASYAQVAALSGRPRAVRAGGTACATNPVPIVLPCHRVVRSDGSTGAYRGGPEAKMALLALEAA